MDRDQEASEVASSHDTRCCIVGAGPAGAVLGLLLARGGVPVTLLESHPDFDRDFRGDTVHPPTLELLAQLGLADRLLAQPQGTVRAMRLRTKTRTFTIADRGHEWQIGYAILKGSFATVKAAGIDSLRQALGEVVPRLAGRTGLLRDWSQVAMLNLESSRVPLWHKPGLLLIGDAAHAMSPV